MIMGHIKEPEGIDFVIQSPPLTKQEKKDISEFIKKSKLNRKKLLKKGQKNKEIA